ncbi:MAG: hypothetical protein GWN62_05355, partial [Aliifodinibius sp.]|nr:hypothetical protein [Fodinibius sp.]
MYKYGSLNPFRYNDPAGLSEDDTLYQQALSRIQYWGDYTAYDSVENTGFDKYEDVGGREAYRKAGGNPEAFE